MSTSSLRMRLKSRSNGPWLTSRSSCRSSNIRYLANLEVGGQQNRTDKGEGISVKGEERALQHTEDEQYEQHPVAFQVRPPAVCTGRQQATNNASSIQLWDGHKVDDPQYDIHLIGEEKDSDEKRPIPPLDGSRIIGGLLSPSAYRWW